MKILTLILILLAAYFFIHSAFFQVSSIEVRGTKRTSAEEMIELSGLTKGENIFQVDRGQAEKKIALNAMVSHVEVKRKLPQTLIINIQEREPAVLIPIAGGLFEIDGEGYILKKDTSFTKLPLPIITGADLPETMAVGKKLASQKLSMGLKMVAQMAETDKKVIAEIDVFDPQKLRAFTVQKAEVRLGDAENFQEKFSTFLQILKEEEKMGRLDQIEYIDVSFSGKPVVFYRNK